MRFSCKQKVSVAGASTVALIWLWPMAATKFTELKNLTNQKSLEVDSRKAILRLVGEEPRQMPWPCVGDLTVNELVRIDPRTFHALRASTPGASVVAARWAENLNPERLAEAVVYMSASQLAGFVILFSAHPGAFESGRGLPVLLVLSMHLARNLDLLEGVRHELGKAFNPAATLYLGWMRGEEIAS
ncbi:MAG TPA: hypothetical protein VF272_01325 [Candidatus Saccharimonadia bacterium]